MTAPAPLYHYYYFYTRRRGITKHCRGNKFILTLMGQVHFNSLLFRILPLKKIPTLGIIAWCQRVWVILCHFLRRAICDVCPRDTRLISLQNLRKRKNCFYLTLKRAKNYSITDTALLRVFFQPSIPPLLLPSTFPRPD